MSQGLLLFYDTETTGVSNRDEIIQWAGILYNLKARKSLGYFNFYFWTGVPISTGAQRIHGIDRKLLLSLSKGVTFEEILYTKLKFLLNFAGTYVSYNNSFDSRFINNTLTLNGYDPLDMGIEIRTNDLNDLGKTRSRFCLMRHIQSIRGGRANSLTDNVTRLGMKMTDIRDEFSVRYPEEKEDLMSHRALFDSFVLMKVFERMI